MSDHRRIVAADIGGTHARFAWAERDGSGGIRLGEPAVFGTSDYAGIDATWPSVLQSLDFEHEGLVVAAAGPLRSGRISLTNAGWTLDQDHLQSLAGTGRALLLNDLAAVGHAAASLPPDRFEHILGPEDRPDEEGVTAIVGIGTGFGLASVHRSSGGYRVQGTEGGHADYPSATQFERQFVSHLLRSRDRVSFETLLSGPAIIDLAEFLGRRPESTDDRALWAMGLDSTDPIAALAVTRFCEMLGGALANIALIQGAGSIVLAGGIGQRLSGRLQDTAFAERFLAKSPMRHVLEEVQVRAITHPEPGLFGAAAAYFAAGPGID